MVGPGPDGPAGEATGRPAGEQTGGQTGGLTGGQTGDLTGDLMVRALAAPEEWSAIAPEWAALLAAAEAPAWSCHPAVFPAWAALWRAPRRGRRTSLLTVRDGRGALVGLMPLMLDHVRRGPAATPRFDYDPRDRALVARQRWRPLPVRQATTMASLPATMLWVGVLARPADRARAARAIAAHLTARRDWDVAVLPAFADEADDWLAAFGPRAHRQALGRVVQDVRALRPFQAIVDGQPKKFRQNVRRAEAAAAEAALTFEIREGDAARAALPLVAALARESWKHTGREGSDVHIRYAGDQQTFVETLLARPDAPDPVVAVASDAEGPLACYLILCHDHAATALLTFWTGRQPQASPGLLLLGRAIDWAAARGLDRFDFNATAPWVRHIVDSRRELAHVVVFAEGWRGRALGALARATGRIGATSGPTGPTGPTGPADSAGPSGP